MVFSLFDGLSFLSYTGWLGARHGEGVVIFGGVLVYPVHTKRIGDRWVLWI
jgi:hypothetical protein